MANICTDNDRLCLPLDRWPLSDRQAWQAAITEGDLMHDAGLAVRWRDGTRKRVIQSYGRFLNFLQQIGLLDKDAMPESRVSRDRVIAYAGLLRSQCGDVTVTNYVLNLERALSVMAPACDWHWIRQLAMRLKARAQPVRNKRMKTVPIEALADLGYNLMNEALSAKFSTAKIQAARFRDGLMIALQCERLFRRRNLAALTLGTHLLHTEDGYRIYIDGSEMKTRRPYDAPLSNTLTPFMALYLQRFRPILLGSGESDRLWITHMGSEMCADHVYGAICKRTKVAFGRPINPHLFRDCAATSRAIDDPGAIRAMTPVLGHARIQTMETYYNYASAMHAGRQYQALVATKRRQFTDQAQTAAEAE